VPLHPHLHRHRGTNSRLEIQPRSLGSGAVPPVPATGGAFAGFGSGQGPRNPTNNEERRIETARQGNQAGAGCRIVTRS
jgi:hypothetical protein